MRARGRSDVVGAFLAAAAVLVGGRAHAVGTAFVRYTSAGVGISLTTGTSNKSGLTSVATNSTGQIFVGGFYSSSSTFEQFGYVAKYSTDGVFDTTFQTLAGVGATWDYHIGDSEVVRDIAVQPDGKVVVLFSVGGSAVVTRLLTNGTKDTTFAPNPITAQIGYVFPFGSQAIAGVALKATATKIVVIGNVEAPTGFRVAQLTTTGALDTTFGIGGVASPSFVLGATAEIARGVAIDPTTNKVVVVGRSNTGNGTMGIVRLTTAGVLDITYDGDGRKLVDVAGILKEEATSVVVDASSSVYVAGRRDDQVPTVPQVYVAKTTSTGAADATFAGATGIANTTFPGGTSGFPVDWSIALTNDTLPKVVVAGTVSTATGNSFGVARFLSTGVLDTGFDGDGKVLTAFSTYNARALDVAYDPVNSKIIAAGTLFTQ